MSKAAAARLHRKFQTELSAFIDLCWTIMVDERWSYEGIHQKGGPTPQTVSRLINKETKSPHYATLVRIGTVLGLEVNWSRIHPAVIPMNKKSKSKARKSA